MGAPAVPTRRCTLCVVSPRGTESTEARRVVLRSESRRYLANYSLPESVYLGQRGKYAGEAPGALALGATHTRRHGGRSQTPD